MIKHLIPMSTLTTNGVICVSNVMYEEMKIVYALSLLVIRKSIQMCDKCDDH